MIRIVRACAFATAIVCVPAALAQTYPSRPIRMLVGFAPGGAAGPASP